MMQVECVSTTVLLERFAQALGQPPCVHQFFLCIFVLSQEKIDHL
jgi:hypothetical protein